MKQLLQKIILLGHRLLYLLSSYPLRIWRFFKHFIVLYQLLFNKDELLVHYRYSGIGVIVWSYEFVFYILDILAIPELFQTIIDFIHWKNRPLNHEEKNIIKSVFNDSINLNTISLDLYKHYFSDVAMAFVGFNTIFFNRKITGELLIHEATHCWQYQRFGSVYIIRALLAQNSNPGYNYGGVHSLENIVMSRQIKRINYEQQAEIITDYYSLLNAKFADPGEIKIYKNYLNLLKIPQIIINK